MLILPDADALRIELALRNPGLHTLLQSRRSSGSATCPIASLESVIHRRGFRPFLDAYSVDVAIVDVIWNGYFESLKIAAMADAYEVNCAPHNYYGHLSSAIGAHFSATIPNFAVMEIDIDSAPWRDELVTIPPTFQNGAYVVSDAPGWGTDISESGVAKHPPIV